MDAILLAGGPPLLVPSSSEPSGRVTRRVKKALLPLAGRPMVGWVLDAVVASGLVERLAIVGLGPEELEESERARLAGLDLTFVPDRGQMLENLLAGRGALGGARGFGLAVMADAPLLTGEVLRRFVLQCGDRRADAYFPVVERGRLEGRFPGAGRTYFPAHAGRYSGGNLWGLRLDAEPPEQVRALIAARKSALRTAWRLGLGTLARFLLRRISPGEAAEVVGRRLGIRAVAVKSPDPEVAMDVDHAHQIPLVEAALRQRRRHG